VVQVLAKNVVPKCFTFGAEGIVALFVAIEQ